MENEKNLEGIGGWLILVAIGIILTPLRIIVFLAQTWPEVFRSGLWEMLTTQGSDYYSPYLAGLIALELLINVVFLGIGIFLLFLFFSRKRSFPRWYIGLAVASLVFVIADAFVAGQIVPDEPIFDAETTREVLRSLFAVMVWVPYMLVSRRVRATFTR